MLQISPRWQKIYVISFKVTWTTGHFRFKEGWQTSSIDTKGRITVMWRQTFEKSRSYIWMRKRREKMEGLKTKK